MLEDKEKKLIKHLYLLSSISIPAIIMAFVIPFIWLIFVFIEDYIFKKDSFNYFGTGVMLATVAFYIIIFSYSLFKVKFGVKKDQWNSITNNQNIYQYNLDSSNEVSRAHTLKAASNVLKSKSLKTMANLESVNITGSIKNNIKKVVDRNNIELNPKKYILGLVLIPTLILFSVYIPSIIQTKKEYDEKIELLINSMENLKSTFEQNDYSADYAKIDIKYSFQYMSIYPYNKNNSHVSLNLSNDGNINDIVYYLDIDKILTVEENVDALYQIIESTNKILKTTETGKNATDLFITQDVFYNMASPYLSGDNLKNIYNRIEKGKISYAFSYLVEGYNEEQPFIYFDVTKYE